MEEVQGTGKMKTYWFDVPCSYTYKVKANSEAEARKMLVEEGGLDIEGELNLEQSSYQNLRFLEVEND